MLADAPLHFGTDRAQPRVFLPRAPLHMPLTMKRFLTRCGGRSTRASRAANLRLLDLGAQGVPIRHAMLPDDLSVEHILHGGPRRALHDGHLASLHEVHDDLVEITTVGCRRVVSHLDAPPGPRAQRLVPELDAADADAVLLHDARVNMEQQARVQLQAPGVAGGSDFREGLIEQLAWRPLRRGRIGRGVAAGACVRGVHKLVGQREGQAAFFAAR